MAEIFPLHQRTNANVHELQFAIQVATKLNSFEIEILHNGSDSPWFSFDVGERKFAIWRETGALYEVDAYDAVPDAPIEIADLDG